VVPLCTSIGSLNLIPLIEIEPITTSVVADRVTFTLFVLFEGSTIYHNDECDVPPSSSERISVKL